MKVDFNKPILGLDDQPLKDGGIPDSLGKLFASMLANRSKGDALKLHGWAKKLYKGEELELDLSDIEIMKAIINDESNYSNLAKSQLLEVLLKAAA